MQQGRIDLNFGFVGKAKALSAVSISQQWENGSGIKRLG